MKRKIAIACQGGGSHTAFTAGVLKAFFQAGVHEKYQIVGISGTSGGAVCAALSWYALVEAAHGDKTPIEKRLLDFWHDNSTTSALEQLFNNFLTNMIEAEGEGLIPTMKLAPGSPLAQALSSSLAAGFPRKNFLDFRAVIEEHLDFERIKSFGKPATPVLLIGAANVCRGEYVKFNSSKIDIKVEHILASAAVPTIFPAVEVDGEHYWDGLFSDNPPTDELIDPDIVGYDNIPEEIWVIQINPTTRQITPVTVGDIEDRQNEMIGNESLFQDLQKINFFNSLLEKGAFKDEFLAKYHLKVPIKIRVVHMSDELMGKLYYASKLDRGAKYIDMLIADGEKQGKELLAQIKE